MADTQLADAMVDLNVDNNEDGHGHGSHRRYNKPRPVRDPEQEARKIYVGNLPYNTNEEQLEQHFIDIGPIESASIARRYQHRSSGFGFIVFENEESVSKAVAVKHSTKIDDREIVVETTIHREQKPRRERKPRSSKPGSDTEGVHEQYESGEGDRKPRNRRPRRDTYDKEVHDGPRFNRRPMQRKKPMSETGTEMPLTIYVHGLHSGVTQAEIQEIFEANDMVPTQVDIRVPRYTHRAFALVEFQSQNVRDSALQLDQVLELAGRKLTIQPAYKPAPRPPKSTDEFGEVEHHLPEHNDEAAKAE